jgi:hypothetical protein
MPTSKPARVTLKRSLLLLLLLACGLSLSGCGSTQPQPPPAPQHSSALDARELTAPGPRIGGQSILAAGDLDTLRALVDASAAATVQQLGGLGNNYQCQRPYAMGRDNCWPGERSQTGQAYVAVAIGSGFCESWSAPRLYLSGQQLVVQIGISKLSNCRINGVMALPTAGLISFSTRALTPGLYGVSYRTVSDGETYQSDSTYLSVPSPAPKDQPTMEREAATALQAVIGDHRVSLFSLARVDGSQLQSLCGLTQPGPAYLATMDPDLSTTRRRMSVVLAGPTPRTCSATVI